jgi:hypothetical protein
MGAPIDRRGRRRRHAFQRIGNADKQGVGLVGHRATW